MLFKFSSSDTPKGIRIPVASVKGRCPRPLDDGGLGHTFINLAAFTFDVNSLNE